MSGFHFLSAMQRIGRTIARQYGINVIYEGNSPGTDGKTIVLPDVQNLTDELRHDLDGYLDHEVGHCRHTDFNVLRSVDNRFQSELLSALEGVRVDREMIRDYPGSQFHINDLNDKLRAKAAEKWVGTPTAIRLLHGVRDGMRGQPIVSDHDTARYLDALGDEISKLNTYTSTGQMRDATARIMKIILEEREREQEEQQQQQQQQQQAGGAGGGDSQSKGGGQKQEDGDQDQEDGDQDEDQDRKGDGDGGGDSEDHDQEGEGDGDQDQQAGGGADEKFDDMITENSGADNSEFDNHATNLQQLMNGNMAPEIEGEPEIQGGRPWHDGFSDAKHIPLTTRFDQIHDVSGGGDPVRYNVLRNKVKGIMSPIRREMERVLKVKENARWRMDRERGHINNRSLSQLVASPGFRTPFKEFQKTETTNVAIQLLVDLSGSMAGSKLQTAKEAATAMAEVLRSLDIPFEVTGFHSEGDYDMQKVAREVGDISRFNRTHERLDHWVYKSFGDSRMDGITRMESGGNNTDGESVRWAAARLAEQKQKRKIMIVFSDGMPACHGNMSMLNGDLVRAVKEIDRSGIEVVGVGIEHNGVSRFYPNNIAINNVEDLTGGVLRKLSSMLTEA